MSDDARIAEIKEILKQEAALSVVVGTTDSIPGWVALSYPVGQQSGMVVGTPMGTGQTEVSAAESLLAEWQSRRA